MRRLAQLAKAMAAERLRMASDDGLAQWVVVSLRLTSPAPLDPALSRLLSIGPRCTGCNGGYSEGVRGGRGRMRRSDQQQVLAASSPVIATDGCGPSRPKQAIAG